MGMTPAPKQFPTPTPFGQSPVNGVAQAQMPIQNQVGPGFLTNSFSDPGTQTQQAPQAAQAPQPQRQPLYSMFGSRQNSNF